MARAILDPTDVHDLERLLRDGAGDDEVCDTFDRLLVSLNAAGSTSKYFAAAGRICFRRPHLAARLLDRPVEGCLALGAATGGDVIRGGVAVSHDPRYAEHAGPDGVRWLREDLPKLTALVERLFADRRAALDQLRHELFDEDQ